MSFLFAYLSQQCNIFASIDSPILYSVYSWVLVSIFRLVKTTFSCYTQNVTFLIRLYVTNVFFFSLRHHG